jgi:hypothetical protein
MFVDDVSGIGLWHHDGNVEGLEGDLEENLEDRLPMPDQLRQRIKSWIDEYTASISDPDVRARWTTDVDLEHDMRGYELSRELQEALGPRFRIEYMFHTREGRRLSDER